MFEFFRTHQKAMQLVLLLLIIPSFALFGLDSYTRMRDGGEPYAEVAGNPIHLEEFDASKRQQIERLRQQLGGAFDPTLLASPAVDQAVLDDLVEDRIAGWVVTQEHLWASDTRLREVIARVPEVQENGQFSLNRYKSLLAAQGRTPEMFEAGLRDDLVRQQVHGPVSISEFLPRAVRARLLQIQNAPRTVQVFVLPTDRFVSKAIVTDEAMAAWYKSNESRFKTPETTEIEYVVFAADDVSAKITVSDADARAYYEQNKARYATPEQRRARHILYAAGKDASSDDKAKAKAKAEAALAQLKANPQRFAELAKAESQDPGSAAQGGDLGLFGKGMMVKPFEDTAFALGKDELSGVVATDFGFHLIQVTDIQTSVARPFETVKAELIDEIRRQQAQSRFAEQAEAFSNLVFDQPDSLKPVIEKFGLTVRKATLTGRQIQRGAPATNPLGSGEFISSLFVDDVLKKGNNSKAVTLSGAVAAGRVIKYAPAAVQAMEVVADQVRAAVVREEAAKLAVAEGKRLLESARQGDAIAWSAELSVSRTKPQGVPPEAVKAALAADTSKLPVVVGAELTDRGYALVKVVSVPEWAAPDLTDGKALNDPQLRNWQESAAQSAALASAAAARKASKTKVIKTFRESQS